MAKYSGSDVVFVSTVNAPYSGYPKVSVLGDGGWLVTWNINGSGQDVYQRRYDAGGHSISEETPVGTGSDSKPAALTDGGWLAAEYDSRGGNDTLFLQRYDDNGDAVGGSTLVNDYVQYFSVNGARVTELDGGGSVVTWVRAVDNDHTDIRQQQFDAEGHKVGSETQVSSDLEEQQNAQVTALKGGGWVVVWTNVVNYDGELFQRAYNAEGEAVGAEQRVKKFDDFANPTYCDAAATPDGGWRLSWREYDYMTETYEIAQQRYDSQGNPINPLKLTEFGKNGFGDVARLDDGGWAMASTRHHNGHYQVWLQVFDASGEPRGRSILVDKDAASNSGGPQVEALDDGRLAVVWQDYRKSDFGNTTIQQEIFSPVKNHAPIAKGEKVTADEDQKVFLDVLANDQDRDHDKLTLDSVSVVSGQATVAYKQDGRVTLKGLGDGLITGQTETIVIRYTIYDGFDYDTADIELKVKGITGPGDKISGTAKDDAMVGKSFWEQMFGKDGNDTINGRGGADNLFGGDGDDTIIGGKGDDTFVGGRGDDVLVGGSFNDYDRFVFNKGDGHDTVQNIGNGTIDLSALHEFRDIADLVRHMHQNENGVVIDLVGDNSITLAKENLMWLSHDNFTI